MRTCLQPSPPSFLLLACLLAACLLLLLLWIMFLKNKSNTNARYTPTHDDVVKKDLIKTSLEKAAQLKLDRDSAPKSETRSPVPLPPKGCAPPARRRVVSLALTGISVADTC